MVLQEEGGGRPAALWRPPAFLSFPLAWLGAHPVLALGLAAPMAAALPLLSWAAGMGAEGLLPLPLQLPLTVAGRVPPHTWGWQQTLPGFLNPRPRA